MILHVAVFVLIDYISLFFIGSAIYLLLPHLSNFLKWSILQQLHIFAGNKSIILGLIFLILLTYQHTVGVVTWHKERRSSTHRQLGPIIVFLGRIIAGVGWLIQSHKSYSIAVFITAIGLYLLA